MLDACEVDWNQSARQQLQKRFGSARAGSRQDLAKQGAFLQRRGRLREPKKKSSIPGLVNAIRKTSVMFRNGKLKNFLCYLFNFPFRLEKIIDDKRPLTGMLHIPPIPIIR